MFLLFIASVHGQACSVLTEQDSGFMMRSRISGVKIISRKLILYQKKETLTAKQQQDSEKK